MYLNNSLGESYRRCQFELLTWYDRSSWASPAAQEERRAGDAGCCLNSDIRHDDGENGLLSGRVRAVGSRDCGDGEFDGLAGTPVDLGGVGSEQGADGAEYLGDRPGAGAPAAAWLHQVVMDTGTRLPSGSDPAGPG